MCIFRGKDHSLCFNIQEDLNPHQHHRENLTPTRTGIVICVGWLCYIGSRLQVTWLNNWVSVPGRVRYCSLSKASRLVPYPVGIGGSLLFWERNYICVFYFFRRNSRI